jgi:hypothetical protein
VVVEQLALAGPRAGEPVLLGAVPQEEQQFPPGEPDVPPADEGLVAVGGEQLASQVARAGE